MWDILTSLLPSWLPWAGGGSLLAVVAAMFFLGVTPVISALAGIGAAILDFLRKVVETVFIPGVLYIAQSTPAILTIVFCGWLLYKGVDAANTRTELALERSRDYFATELKGFKATLAKTRQELAQCKAAVGKKLQKQGSDWPF